MENETKELLLNGARTIKELRRQNEVLRARVETMELFRMVLMTQPHQDRCGAEVDVAWRMESAATRLEPEQCKPEPAKPPKVKSRR